MAEHFRTKGSLPLQDVLITQPIQVYGNIGVPQPLSVYFSTPQAVTVPEPVSVYFASTQPVNVVAPNPVQVYGNIGVAQPVSVYFNTPQAVTIPEPVSVYGTVGVPQPLNIYGNVGVFQPVSVYFQTPQSITESNQPQPPFQIYGSAQGVQVYGNVGVAQPVSVYFQTPQTINIPEPVSVYGTVGVSQPINVYGNVGVFQPISVYFQTPQSITESNQPQPPFQIYGSAQGVQVYGNVGVAQPISVYGAVGLAPVSVYDTQVFSDTNQVFSGLIGAGANQNLQIVPPQANLSFSASLIDIWNVYSVAETVALRFGANGQFRFLKNLNPSTGFVANLINSTWRGPTSIGLYIYTFEVMGGPFPAAGGFVTYTVMGQYLP
jgi:hypothetical protein